MAFFNTHHLIGPGYTHQPQQLNAHHFEPALPVTGTCVEPDQPDFPQLWRTVLNDDVLDAQRNWDLTHSLPQWFPGGATLVLGCQPQGPCSITLPPGRFFAVAEHGGGQGYQHVRVHQWVDAGHGMVLRSTKLQLEVLPCDLSTHLALANGEPPLLAPPGGDSIAAYRAPPLEMEPAQTQAAGQNLPDDQQVRALLARNSRMQPGVIPFEALRLLAHKTKGEYPVWEYPDLARAIGKAQDRVVAIPSLHAALKPAELKLAPGHTIEKVPLIAKGYVLAIRLKIDTAAARRTPEDAAAAAAQPSKRQRLAVARPEIDPPRELPALDYVRKFFKPGKAPAQGTVGFRAMQLLCAAPRPPYTVKQLSAALNCPESSLHSAIPRLKLADGVEIKDPSTQGAQLLLQLRVASEDARVSPAMHPGKENDWGLFPELKGIGLLAPDPLLDGRYDPELVDFEYDFPRQGDLLSARPLGSAGEDWLDPRLPRPEHDVGGPGGGGILA